MPSEYFKYRKFKENSNINTLICGNAGTGKSEYIRNDIYANDKGDDKFIVISDKDFSEVLNKYNGTKVVLSPTSEYSINLFDLFIPSPIKKDDEKEMEMLYEQSVKGKADVVIAFFNNVAKRKLNVYERQLIEICVQQTYEKELKNIYMSGEYEFGKDYTIFPTFINFYECVLEMAETEAYPYNEHITYHLSGEAKNIAELLKPFVEEGEKYYGLFTRHTYLPDGKVIVFGNKGNVILSVVFSMLLSVVEHRVKTTTKGEKIHMFVDEADKILQDGYSAITLRRILILCRTADADCTISLQNIRTIIGNELNRSIMQYFKINVLFKLSKTDIDYLNDTYNIIPNFDNHPTIPRKLDIERYIVTSETGEFVMILNDKEKEVFCTNTNEFFPVYHNLYKI